MSSIFNSIESNFSFSPSFLKEKNYVKREHLLISSAFHTPRITLLARVCSLNTFSFSFYFEVARPNKKKINNNNNRKKNNYKIHQKENGIPKKRTRRGLCHSCV